MLFINTQFLFPVLQPDNLIISSGSGGGGSWEKSINLVNFTSFYSPFHRCLFGDHFTAIFTFTDLQKERLRRFKFIDSSPHQLFFCEKSYEGPKWLKLLLCILRFQISTAFQVSHYLLPRKFESWPFWARCLKEIAYRSTLLYIKDIFLKNSVQTYGFNQ